MSVEVFMQCLVVGVGLSCAKFEKPITESWVVLSVSQRTAPAGRSIPSGLGLLLSVQGVTSPVCLPCWVLRTSKGTPCRRGGGRAPALLPAWPGPHLSSHCAGLTHPISAGTLPWLPRDPEPSCGRPGLQLGTSLLCPPAFLQLTRPLLARLR